MSEEDLTLGNNGPRLQWLARYSSKDEKYQWKVRSNGRHRCYHRPLGLVECAFDSDGRFYQGRADINLDLTVELRSHLSDQAVQDRILQAWSTLRLNHPMLRAKALLASDFLPRDAGSPEGEVHFVIERPLDLATAHKEASDSISFLGDHYESVDADEFWKHAQNTTRVVDPERCLARLFVFPLEASDDQPRTRFVRFLLIAAHEIADGLTTLNWLSHLLILFNNPVSIEASDLDRLFSSAAVRSRFPLAQETLYPQISGSLARRRWFWALTIVLRHVHPPVQEGFRNPLRRRNPLPSGSAVPVARKFPAVLDYGHTPPLNTFFTGKVSLSGRATRRLHNVCRSAGLSIGAGTFALAGLVSMEIYEQRNPSIALSKRQPFVVSFPLDPRAMFNHPHPPESVMLAFSQGIVLPFLPAHLPVMGRLKLLARLAHRQLRAYQKRAPKTTIEEAEKNPSRLLATNYMSSVERAQGLLPPELRTPSDEQPQGELRAFNSAGRATHGISAIGAFKGALRRGAFPLDVPGKDFAADFRECRAGPKVRDDEFLVGSGGDEHRLWFSASYDGNAIDETLVEEWKEKMLGRLDFEDDSKL